jgi:hypothetical protein
VIKNIERINDKVSEITGFKNIKRKDSDNLKKIHDSIKTENKKNENGKIAPVSKSTVNTKLV